MAEKERSAAFNLKTAKSLIGDVAQQTEDVVQLQKLAHEEERFLESLKISWKATSEVEKLKEDLALAIELANKDSRMESDLHLEDGTTSETVIAEAHFHGGLIEFRLGDWEKALNHFDASCAKPFPHKRHSLVLHCVSLIWRENSSSTCLGAQKD